MRPSRAVAVEAVQVMSCSDDDNDVDLPLCRVLLSIDQHDHHRGDGCNVVVALDSDVRRHRCSGCVVAAAVDNNIAVVAALSRVGIWAAKRISVDVAVRLVHFRLLRLCCLCWPSSLDLLEDAESVLHEDDLPSDLSRDVDDDEVENDQSCCCCRGRRCFL